MRHKANSLVTAPSKSKSSSVGSKNDLEKGRASSTKKTVSRSKSEGSTVKASKSNKPKGGDEMVFLFVARDADILIYENHIKKQIETASFRADVDMILNDYQETDDVEARPPT